MEKYFLVQIRHNSTTDAWDKGVVVKDTLNAARQSFHAYLGAYGFGNSADTDYVACYTIDSTGMTFDACVDDRLSKAEPEPEPEPEEEN